MKLYLTEHWCMLGGENVTAYALTSTREDGIFLAEKCSKFILSFHKDEDDKAHLVSFREPIEVIVGELFSTRPHYFKSKGSIVIPSGKAEEFFFIESLHDIDMDEDQGTLISCLTIKLSSKDTQDKLGGFVSIEENNYLAISVSTPTISKFVTSEILKQ
jgi:hypothetical protein